MELTRWDTFSERHVDDVVVRWPAQPPTNGIDAHRKEGGYFFSAFPDNHVGNNPYKVLFAQGEWTCSMAEFTGTHKGPMMAPGPTRSASIQTTLSLPVLMLLG
ncbi:MAG: ester cyclase [Thermoproteota archaeon]|nr:ester cyclase [Thermoproteota archaeon]